MSGAITAGTTATLTAAGAIDQTGGIITATTLTTGSSVGSTTLGTLASPVANLIGTLGAFETGTGFSLTNAQTLAVSGADVSGLGFTGVNAGTGALTLETTTGDLDLQTATGNLTAGPATGSQIVTLVSAGAIDQTGGIITAGTLTGSAGTDATMPDANLVGALSSFSAGTNLAFINAQSLIATGVSAGSALGLTTQSGDLTLSGAITAGTTATLTAGGALDQTGGIITAGTLTGSSVGSTTLGTLASPVANLIGTLGAFETGTGFSLTNAQTLAVSGADVSGLGFTGVNAGTGALTLETTTGDLDLQTATGNLTAGPATGSQIVTLVSAGAIDQTGGIITAGTLTGSAGTDATMPDANLVGALSSFSAGTNLAFINAQSLIATGVSAGSALGLTTQSGDLTLSGAITAGTTATLTAAGALDQTGGSITATTLSGSAGTDATMNDANLVGTLSGFSAGGNLGFTNAVGLTLLGPATAGDNVFLVTTTGSIAYPGSGGTVTAMAGDIVLWSKSGSVATGVLSAGDDILVRATSGTAAINGAVNAGTANMDTGATGAADQFLSANPTLALTLFGSWKPDALLTNGGNVDIWAQAVKVSGTVTAGVSPSTSQHGNAWILATGGVTLANVSTAEDIVVQGGTVVTQALTAGRDIAVEAVVGDPSTTVPALDLASGSASGDIVLGTLASTASLTVTGALTAKTASLNDSGGAGVNLFSSLTSTAQSLKGLFTIDGSSPSVFIASQGAITLGAAVDAANVALDATGLGNYSQFGGTLAASSNGASETSIDYIAAQKSLSLFASQSEGTTVSTEPILSLGNFTGNAPQLNIYSKGKLQVIGAVNGNTSSSILTVGATDQTTGWTPRTIWIINDGTTGGGANVGSIGANNPVSTPATPSFSSVTLTATGTPRDGETGGVFMGSTEFIKAYSSVAIQDSQINPSPPFLLGTVQSKPSPDETLIAASSLSLFTNGRIIQENTNGAVPGTQGAGLSITNTITLGTATPALTPTLVDLYGVFTGPPKLTGSQVAVAPGISVTPNANSGQRGLYRINSCVIGSLGNCTPTSIPVFNITPATLVAPDLAPQALDLEDLTVTAAPNDEIWRRLEDDK